MTVRSRLTSMPELLGTLTTMQREREPVCRRVCADCGAHVVGRYSSECSVCGGRDLRPLAARGSRSRPRGSEAGDRVGPHRRVGDS